MMTKREKEDEPPSAPCPLGLIPGNRHLGAAPQLVEVVELAHAVLNTCTTKSP